MLRTFLVMTKFLRLHCDALVIEVVCHFGGPKYTLRIHPVAKHNSDKLREMILEALVLRFPVYVTIAKQMFPFMEN